METIGATRVEHPAARRLPFGLHSRAGSRRKCLKLMDPIPAETGASFGYMKGTVTVNGDVTAPIDVRRSRLGKVSALLLDTHIWLWYAEGNRNGCGTRNWGVTESNRRPAD
jgi:hypothetical protein